MLFIASSIHENNIICHVISVRSIFTNLLFCKLEGFLFVMSLYFKMLFLFSLFFFLLFFCCLFVQNAFFFFFQGIAECFLFISPKCTARRQDVVFARPNQAGINIKVSSWFDELLNAGDGHLIEYFTCIYVHGFLK